MVIKRLFILLLFIPQFAFSESYVKDNNIYNDGNKVKTILINDELGSVLLDNKDVIVISNSYNASSTKTELNYVFSKLNGNILKMEQVNYSPEYDRYYGYFLNFPNGINVEDINGKLLSEKYMKCEYLNESINSSSCKEIGFVNKRSYLYTSPNSISKMYLIKGDQVIINDVKSLKNEKWYLINYKGKKEINMWIKADSVDLN